ncbi:DUF4129 domain-containing protein [Flavobacterium sp. ST-87]|uniref:DUF4129 domain-containing protein n=1 Tax=Flavobacterium plantiphilum TaxID=3163297 RepID=A0ABW8XRJ5_9FLAO
MNKLILFFLLLTGVSSRSQDSLAVAKSSTMPINEKEILVDNSIIKPLKFDPNYKKSYQSSDFIYDVKIAEKGIWDRFLNWLSFWFKKIFGLPNMDVSGKYVNLTLKTIAILLIVYVIYSIVKLILNKEEQWIFGKSTAQKILKYDDIELNLKHIDFEKLIKDTLKSGEQRLAIRYYYLWLLKKMSEKNVIDWNPEKTNSDYLYEIKNESIRNDFGYVSYLYNYIWYGEFDLDEITFEKAKKTFEKTLQSIS